MANTSKAKTNFFLRQAGDNLHVEILRRDFESIKEAKERYFQLIKIEENFDAVLEDYAELEEILSHYGIRHLVFFTFDNNEFQSMRQQINRRLLHLFSASRLYRDALLKHGRELLTEDIYKRIKDEFTDSSQQPIEFRIVEALRNFSQHQDFPISGMATTAEWESSANNKKERAAHFITISIDAHEVSERRELADDLKKALLAMGPQAEIIGHVRKYIEHLGSIHDVFRALVSNNEEIWEKTMRDAMNHFSHHSLPALFLVYATKKEPSSTEEIQLFDDFFNALALLRKKNLSQQNLSKRYVRWSGLPSE